MTTFEAKPEVCNYHRIRELRVKIKSLADESRMIRKEERRCLDSLSRTPEANFPEQRSELAYSYRELRAHRIGTVRHESRYSLLAYALLRGRSPESTEPNIDKTKVNKEKLIGLVERFGAIRTGSLMRMRVQKGQATAMVEQWLAATPASE